MTLRTIRIGTGLQPVPPHSYFVLAHKVEWMSWVVKYKAPHYSSTECHHALIF